MGFKKTLAAGITAVALCALVASESAMALPFSYFYFKDASATNNTGFGTTDPNDFFVTPITGVQALSFTQPSKTLTASAQGASSSTTFSGSIAPGRIAATSGSSTSGSFGGQIGTGLSSSAEQSLRFRDTITPMGGNVGDPVNLTIMIELDSLLSSINVFTGSGTLCGFGAVNLYAAVNQGQVAVLAHNLCLGADHQTATAQISAVVGTGFELELGMSLFSQSVIGAGNRNGSSSSVDASQTGLAFLAAPQGFSFATASGALYQAPLQPTPAPEPGILSLLGIGVLAASLGALRRRARAAG